jgi:hypothetical protein
MTDQEKADQVQRALGGEVLCRCGVWGPKSTMFARHDRFFKMEWCHTYPCDACGVDYGPRDIRYPMEHSAECIRTGRHKET